MEISSLDQEKKRAIHMITSSASRKLLRMTLVVIFLGYLFISTILRLMDISLTSLESIEVIIIVQFAAFLAVPTIFLHHYLQKEQGNFKLTLLEPALKSVSYVWKWFFMVSGIQLSVCAVFYVVVSALDLQKIQMGSDVRLAIGIAATVAAYQIATSRVALHLLKTGEACLEPVSWIKI